MQEIDSKVLADIRSEVCDTVLKWTTVIGGGVAALSLSRVLEFGFLPVMALHVLLVSILSATYFARKRVAFAARAGIIVAVMLIIAVGGHVTFGTPTRIEFFIAASIMAAVFFGERVGITVAAAGAGLLAAVYAGFAFGVLAPPVDPPPLSPTNWLTNTASMVLAALAPLLAVSRYRFHLNAERERAAAASRAKSDFLATMSHELRTPMTAILGMADILLIEETPDHIKDKISRISKAGRLLLSLLNDVLDFSKVESNTIIIAPEPFSPRRLIQDIRDLFAPLASEKSLILQTSVAPDVHENLVADVHRLRQAVMNLVGNAIKFTERGTISIRAAEIRGAAGLTLQIEVEDTGIGISAEHQSKLFQPFVQADQGGRRRYGGTGLGLVISRQLIELMGGMLSLRSAAGTGSTFTVSIPVETAPDAGAGTTLSPSPEANVPPTSLRILVADDTESVAFLLAAMLRKWGHAVDTVSDGQAAVAAVQAREFDVILMDMQMPVMSGPDAMKAIRALDGERSRTPMIAVTADVASENRGIYLSAGAFAVLAKPVDWNQLARTLRECTAATRPAQPVAAP